MLPAASHPSRSPPFATAGPACARLAAVVRPGRYVRRLSPLALALFALLAGCSGGPRYGAPSGATKQGRQVNHLFTGFVTTAIVVFAIVWILVFWSIIRYRRRGRSDVPKQVHSNIPLEITLTVIPLLIVAVLFGFTVHTQNNEDRVSAHPDVRIAVTAFQWGWRFQYDGVGVNVFGDANREPEMVLPVDAKIRLDLRSVDVIHSFYVPGFLFKRDVIPRVHNSVEVDTTRRGRFRGLCAEYCGLDHARMGFWVRVVDRPTYDRWVRDHRSGGTT
jgi:cytochrome c oxidase subunit II